MITINPNEALNVIVKNLKAGATQSLNAKNCAYRGENGAKCFIGMLIPDEVYDPQLDQMGCTVTDLANGFLYFKPIQIDYPADSKTKIKVMQMLQSIHDDPRNWNKKSKKVTFNERGWDSLENWAFRWNLKWPNGQ